MTREKAIKGGKEMKHINADKLLSEIECEQEQDWEKILEFAHNKGWL